MSIDMSLTQSSPLSLPFRFHLPRQHTALINTIAVYRCLLRPSTLATYEQKDVKTPIITHERTCSETPVER